MHSTASTSNLTETTTSANLHGDSFAKVLNGRKQPIRGLWVRNGLYYAQLKIEDLQSGLKKTRRVSLIDKDGQPVRSVKEAEEELRRLQVQRSDNLLPMLRQNPKLSDYVEIYLGFIGSGVGAKQASTIAKESGALKNWKKEYGELRLGSSSGITLTPSSKSG